MIGTYRKQLTERTALIVLIGIKGQKHAIFYAPEPPLDLFPGAAYYRRGMA